MAGRFKMRRLRGFTLVEMIIVVAIIAIVMSYAVPAYNRFVAQNKVQSFAYALAADLGQARSEAIRRGADVTVCAASQSTATSCGTAAQWNQNWIMLVRTGGASGTVLKVHQAEAGAVALASLAGFRFAPSVQVKSDARNSRISSSEGLVIFRNSDSTVSATVTVAPYGSIKVGN